jgi:hypothetical protein
MNIFHGKSAGRADVPCDSPTQMSLDTALAVFRGLDPKSGFIGIVLDDRFTLQLFTQRQGGVRVELLDTSIPAFDACLADTQFAESLIQAAADGRDIFQIARTRDYEWEHLDMA